MMKAWNIPELTTESEVQGLIRQKEQAFRDGYYVLGHSEYVSIDRETALVDSETTREELATKLARMERDLAQRTQEMEAKKASRLPLEEKLAKETESFGQRLATATSERQSVEASLGQAHKEVEEKENEL